jgi:hypothetical protein
LAGSAFLSAAAGVAPAAGAGPGGGCGCSGGLSRGLGLLGHLHRGHYIAGFVQEGNAGDLDVADVEAMAEFQIGDVQFDQFGQGLGHAHHAHLAHGLGEFAALAHAGALTLEAHREAETSLTIGGGFQEIDVEHGVGDGLELFVVQQGVALLPVDVEAHAESVGGMHDLAQGAFVHAEVEDVLAAVEHAGYLLVAAYRFCAGGALAGALGADEFDALHDDRGVRR